MGFLGPYVLGWVPRVHGKVGGGEGIGRGPVSHSRGPVKRYLVHFILLEEDTGSLHQNCPLGEGLDQRQ